MPTEILMPALSPTMEEGTLAKWLVAEGDTVAAGDIIAEIETDKATMEFEAVDEGTIGKILIAAGTEGVKVNTPIAVLLEEGESAGDMAASGNGDAAGKTEAQGDAPVGTANGAGQKASGAGEKGTTRAPEHDAEDGHGDDAIAAAPPAPQDAQGERVFASPLARRIAAEKGLDLTGISGSGPHGRIVRADVEAAQPAPARDTTRTEAAPASEQAPQPKAAAADQVARIYADRPYDEVTLDGMRRTVAARLTEAKQTIPHFYLRRSVRLDALLEFRSRLNRQLEGRGVKLSVNDFIIKACALALQTVPDANAVWAGDRILRLKPSDVAVAVAVDGGLFTPVIQDAHSKTLSAISAEMKDLAARARDRKLKPHEYLGGSFAISNLGMYGIENFDAVINPPHGSILAVGSGTRQPVVGTEGELTTATVMSMTLSVDHRVIDGALGADFLAAIIDNLENPMVMLA